MDDLTDHEWRTFIRAVVNAEDGAPNLDDLPDVWDRIDPKERDTNLPNYTRRDILLSSYSNWSFSKRWAWDGLQRLLKVLMDRREPIPETLQRWAFGVAAGSWPRPRKAQNEERDSRMADLVRIMRDNGWTREAAIAEIAEALPPMDGRTGEDGHLPTGTARSAVDKVRDAHPFK